MSEPSAEPVLPEPARAIIAELSGFDGLPRDALRAAAENWDAVLPSFLEMLEGYVRDPRAADVGRCDALFFIIHLFGQMREERAYPLLMRFLSMDPDDVRAVLGDSVTETLPRLAISMFDGDPGPLEAVVKDKDADEFVRSALLEALAFVTGEGRVELEHTKSFLRECDGGLEPRDGSFVWVGWQNAISYLGLSEFRDMVRKAFKDGRIEPSFMSFHHFEEDLRAVAEPESGATHPDGERLGYFGDAVEEFSSWYGFSAAYREEREKAARRRIAEALEPEKPEDRGAPRPEGLDMTLPSEPRVNPLRHVGRNDPCPCGSGKKFKKCCLK